MTWRVQPCPQQVGRRPLTLFARLRHSGSARDRAIAARSSFGDVGTEDGSRHHGPRPGPVVRRRASPAGRPERAIKVAWIGALVASALTEAIGIAAAIFPHAWLSLFGDDPTMNAVGVHYLRVVGPFYGFFGMGLALYFASQGAGRLGWPLLATYSTMWFPEGRTRFGSRTPSTTSISNRTCSGL